MQQHNWMLSEHRCDISACAALFQAEDASIGENWPSMTSGEDEAAHVSGIAPHAACAAMACVPFGHGRQCTDPCLEAKVPAGHRLHVDWPAVALKVPGEQSRSVV